MSHGHLNSINPQRQPAWFIFSSDGPQRQNFFFFLRHGNGIFSLLYVNNPPDIGEGKSSYQKGMVTKISASPCYRRIISITEFLLCSKKNYCQVSQRSISVVAAPWQQVSGQFVLCVRQCWKEKKTRCWVSWWGGWQKNPPFQKGHWVWGLQQKNEMNCFLSRNQFDIAWRNIFLEREAFLHLLVHFLHCSITYEHRYSGLTVLQEESESDVLVMYSDT